MKPTTAPPSNIVPMYPDLTASPADSGGRVAVTVPIIAGHDRMMRAREFYSPEWHGRIVRDYLARVLISISYHRGAYGITPGPGKSLAASLAHFKDAADAWGNITRRPVTPFTFDTEVAEWREYQAAAAAVGVPLAALVRAAVAHRVRLWVEMDSATSHRMNPPATMKRKPRIDPPGPLKRSITTRHAKAMRRNQLPLRKTQPPPDLAAVG